MIVISVSTSRHSLKIYVVGVLLIFPVLNFRFKMAVLHILVLVTMVTVTTATKFTVDTSKVIHTTDDHYISFNVDSGFFGNPDRWKIFDIT